MQQLVYAARRDMVLRERAKGPKQRLDDRAFAVRCMMKAMEGMFPTVPVNRPFDTGDRGDAL